MDIGKHITEHEVLGVKKASDIDLNDIGDVTASSPNNSQPLTWITGSSAWLPVSPQNGIGFILDGVGSVITTGIKGDIEVPYNCYITEATLLADQTGSMTIDIWKDTYANFPPTVADTITSSTPPSFSNALKSQDSTLTGWTSGLSKGDILRFNVGSADAVTNVALNLLVNKA